jgi:hypothetical protein
VPQSWTPDQIRQFQDYWDTEFSGDLAKRRRAKFVPGESAAKVVQTKEPQHKDDFDEWLARIICYAFSVPPQWAAKVMNRATADNQSAQAEEEGLEPTKEWVKDLIDEIIAEEFASPDLELHWLDEDKDDPEALLEARLKVGAVTLNEMRDALGLDPYDNAAADRPMVLTATGYVPIEANAGGEGNNTGRAAANEHGASLEPLSAKLPLGKASADDLEHPGWPAGTPGGRGGKFRPKDEKGSDASSNSTAAARTISTLAPNATSRGASEGLQPRQYAQLSTRTQTDATTGGDSPHSGQVQLVNDIPPKVGLRETLKSLVEIGRVTEEDAAEIQRSENAYEAFEHARFMAAVEGITVREAQSILSSEEFAQLRAAYLAGEERAVTIGGRLIEYDPTWPPGYYGSANYAGNGFTLGPSAFSNPTETQATVLHEVFRLNTTVAGVATVHGGESAAIETQAAAEFVKKIIQSGVMNQ